MSRWCDANDMPNNCVKRCIVFGIHRFVYVFWKRCGNATIYDLIVFISCRSHVLHSVSNHAIGISESMTGLTIVHCSEIAKHDSKYSVSEIQHQP